jgi:aryl-alcohol dehydrogenase-like predicted oxidoreductase
VTPPRRRLGATELLVHPLCLGGNVFGWTADRAASFAVLDAYLGAGGNFVDTADVYSSWVAGHPGGESERILGEWLASRGARDDIVVATKVGSGAEDVPEGLGRAQILAGCDASLRRLGVERIDLYYAHRDDPDTPLAETMSAFDELVRAGKVAHVAASNYSAVRLPEALEISRREGVTQFQALQPELNLVDREDFGEDARAVCREADLGVAVYSALAGGFLSDKYRRAEPVPSGDRAEDVADEYLSEDRAWAVLDAARAVARELGVSVAEVAVAWVVAQPEITCAIASATRVEQLRELMAGAELELSAEVRERLDKAD